jgi:choline dehydrogenase-like flavoprotein
MIIEGRNERSPLALRVDAVVVGSGAGGAIVARELARAGKSVVVLEEGGHYTPERYGAMRPTESLRHLFRDSGLAVATGLGDTPIISVLAGRCFGGSSVLTGGVCFRIPDEVLHDWSTRLGLARITPDDLDARFSEIEADLHVTEVPSALRSRSTELFMEGADALGIPMKPLKRNAPTCKGSSRCSFGCPTGAKRSVDVAVLPEAIERGATVVCDAFVARVLLDGRRARGVEGYLLDERGGKGPAFHIDADLVVVACGSQHTPLLLKRSGISSPHLGRHLTLHPGLRIGAIFDERVDGWDGAMQSVYSDHFANEGITLVGIYSTPNVLAAALPGAGRDHRRLVEQMPHLAFFGAMVHDEGSGVIRRWLGREPLVTYRMAERDRSRLRRALRILGEMAFAAGAREVLLPVFGAPPVRTQAELAQVIDSMPSLKNLECAAFHPLGSARMSTRPEDGVVSRDGAVWNTEGLYVADGSILPTSIGVNSQLPVMSLALDVARGIVEGRSTRARAA